MFQNRLQLTDEELQAIGLVAQQWALFESMITNLVIVLLEARPDKGAIVGVAMGNRLALELVSSLAETALKPESIKRVKKYMERAKKLQGKRNDCVHLVWSRSPTDPAKLKPMGMKVRDNIKIAQGESSANDFSNLAEEIYTLTAEIAGFLQEIGQWPLKVPDTTTERPLG